MKYLKLFLFCLAILLSLISLIFVINYNQNKPLTPDNTESLNPTNFFDESSFYSGVNQVKKDSNVFTYLIRGGIIPHHLLAGRIIADFFYRLSKQSPKTIILVGPNHYEKGNSLILTSDLGWQTPFGVVKTNKKIIESLKENEMISFDDETLSGDHSVAGLIPFIKFYLPETEVVPVLLSSKLIPKEIQELANQLKKYADKDTVIVASVDFSHYLTSSEARDNDKISLEILKSYNYAKLFTLSNSYLDSPSSIAAVLMTMEELKTTNMEVLFHTNSGEMMKKESVETTSYFSIAYY